MICTSRLTSEPEDSQHRCSAWAHCSIPLCLGTEFEYTDSESEIKIRKKSPSGLLRGKKGLMDQGSAAPSQTASILDPSSGSSDKVKVGVEKGRKLKKFKSPKDLSFEFGLEVSDDDLWNRRRSERIFLHDASASSSVLTPATPASSTPASKPARCGKGAPLSPKKDGSKGKERKELNKVGVVLRQGQKQAVGEREGGLHFTALHIQGLARGVATSAAPRCLSLLTAGSPHLYPQPPT